MKDLLFVLMKKLLIFFDQQPIQRQFELTEDRYPIDSDGYAVSFDPITQPEDLVKTWLKYGFIVGKNVVSKEICSYTVKSIKETVLYLSDQKCVLDDPSAFSYMPMDDKGVPILTRGFLRYTIIKL